jgi:hypothetical protein
MTSSEVEQWRRVVRNELLRIRSEAQETGWREEEAKDLAVEVLEVVMGFLTAGCN